MSVGKNKRLRSRHLFFTSHERTNRLRKQAVERECAGFVSLRYNESKRKTSDTEGGICFSWTINEGSACESRQ